MVREDFTEEPENRSDGVFRYVPKQRDKEILQDLCGSQEKQRLKMNGTVKLPQETSGLLLSTHSLAF